WLGIAGWQSLIVRLVLASMITGWGIWLSFKRPWDHDLRHGPDGTVILTVPRPWWRNKKLFTAVVIAFAWLYVQEHWLLPLLRREAHQHPKVTSADTAAAQVEPRFQPEQDKRLPLPAATPSVLVE